MKAIDLLAKKITENESLGKDTTFDKSEIQRLAVREQQLRTKQIETLRLEASMVTGTTGYISRIYFNCYVI